MAEQSTVIRASGELLKQIDAYAAAIERKTGVRVTRSETTAALIRLGLRVASTNGIRIASAKGAR